jgi:hypothetical protein
MASDLAAVAPSAIVCAAFLIGLGMLVRHELAPKRRARAEAEADRDESETAMTDERSES